MKTSLLAFLCFVLPHGVAYAQGFFQNIDLALLAGPSSVKSRVVNVGGSNVSYSGSTGYSWEFDVGYQVVQTTFGSLWVEFYPTAFTSPGKTVASGSAVPSSVSYDATVMAPGVRFMVPVTPRLSLYGVTGGGPGIFDYSTGPRQYGGSWHGVFDFGGGADFRFSRYFSLRGEFRDFVTGSNLAGVAGRNHTFALGGLAFHF